MQLPQKEQSRCHERWCDLQGVDCKSSVGAAYLASDDAFSGSAFDGRGWDVTSRRFAPTTRSPGCRRTGSAASGGGCPSASPPAASMLDTADGCPQLGVADGPVLRWRVHGALRQAIGTPPSGSRSPSSRSPWCTLSACLAS